MTLPEIVAHLRDAVGFINDNPSCEDRHLFNLQGSKRLTKSAFLLHRLERVHEGLALGDLLGLRQAGLSRTYVWWRGGKETVKVGFEERGSGGRRVICGRCFN